MAREREPAETAEEDAEERAASQNDPAAEAEQTPTAPEAAEPGPETDQETDADGREDDPAEPSLEQVQVEAAAHYDRYVRAVAELDNYRKRNAKVRTEAREDILRDIILKVAPVLDNFKRALSQEGDDAQALKQGVELIFNQLKEALQSYGIEEIGAVGEPFDPALHEALLEVEHDEHPAGTVVEEVEKGYQLNDKVVRPSRVVVSKGSPEKG